MIKRALLLLIALLAAPAAARGQPVQGRLIQRETETPVRGGVVHLVAADSQVAAQAMTDTAGAFVLQAPRPGRYFLLASAPGHETSETDWFELGAQGSRFTFVIGRAPVRLDPVVAQVAGRENRLWHGGFHERMSQNRGGRFVSREQIERSHPTSLADLLRAVPGLDVRVGGSDPSARKLVVRLRHPSSIRSACNSIFYLNGMQIATESVAELAIDDVEGVEVYTGGAIPAQFNSSIGSTCGVIAVWTRVR